jgi:hypothetical protein
MSAGARGLIMGEIDRHDLNERRAKRLRGAIYIAIAAQVLVWLGLFSISADTRIRGRRHGMGRSRAGNAHSCRRRGAALRLSCRKSAAAGRCADRVRGVVLGVAFSLEIVREFGEAAAR